MTDESDAGEVMSRKLQVVCYAPGDTCLGCAHYRGEVDTCEHSDKGEQAMTTDSDAGVEGLPYVVRNMQRALNEEMNRGGIRAGMPHVKLSADHVQAVLKYIGQQRERLTTAQRTIEKLREDIQSYPDPYWKPLYEAEKVLADQLRRELDEARKECFALAANQCHDGYGDDRGYHQCKVVDWASGWALRWKRLAQEYRRERDEAREELARLYKVAVSSTPIADLATLQAKHERVVKLLRRYRNETPLGHQPHMIASEVDAALRGEEN